MLTHTSPRLTHELTSAILLLESDSPFPPLGKMSRGTRGSDLHSPSSWVKTPSPFPKSERGVHLHPIGEREGAPSHTILVRRECTNARMHGARVHEWGEDEELYLHPRPPLRSRGERVGGTAPLPPFPLAMHECTRATRIRSLPLPDYLLITYLAR